MAIIFDQVSAEITPPVPTSSVNERQSDTGAPQTDAQSVLREIQRVAERAARLSAD